MVHERTGLKELERRLKNRLRKLSRLIENEWCRSLGCETFIPTGWRASSFPLKFHFCD